MPHRLSSVALRLPMALGCRVEDLFRLSEERICVDTEGLGEASTREIGRRCIQPARVGGRPFARPLTHHWRDR
jgi:hypothetical protein